MELDPKRDVKIDHLALDVEWLEQPELMRRYCSRSADLRAEMDQASNVVEEVKAKVNADVRSNPEKYGLNKTTETAINNAVILDPEYQNAVVDHLESKRVYWLARGDVQSMEQRKTALENMVKLYGQSYFAGPKVPRDLHEERQRRDRDMTNRIGRKMRRQRV